MHNKPSNPPPDDLRRIDLEAAEWLIKHDRGFTPTEQDHYFQWLAADPRHGEWFARHRETWRELNTLAQWRPEHSPEPNPDLLAPTHPGRDWRRWAWSGALAAAASLALLLFLGAPSWTTGPVETEAAPAAPAYERRVLADGSVIELNRGAQVAVAFTAAERRVYLRRGEALFTVARNPARPFIVDAAGVKVRAVGTAFNVRLADKAVEVLVTEGRVQVRPPAHLPGPAAADGALLQAGQRAVIARGEAAPAAPQVDSLQAEEMARLLAWLPKLFDFDSVPLCDVAIAFNRCNRVKLVIADSSLNLMPIVASFRSDNVEGFVRLLEATTEVRADRAGDTITLRRAP